MERQIYRHTDKKILTGTNPLIVKLELENSGYIKIELGNYIFYRLNENNKYSLKRQICLILYLRKVTEYIASMSKACFE